MLNDIKLEVHNIECLLKKARTLGVISRMEDVNKNRKNSILIGKIEKIYPLIEESELCNRNQLKLVLKEVYPDGKYGHHFLTVFFNEIAVEIDSAKFDIGDKLLFVEPQVFPYAPHRPNKALHNLHVQIGLSDKLSPTVWFARKYSQEMARRHGRQNKLNKIKTTSKSTATAPVANFKKPQVPPSSVITDVTKNETDKIETLDAGKWRLDDLDKTGSDCFVVLEDMIVSSHKKQISDNENNNNKQNTQLKIGAELQSKNSSKNEVAHVNELIVDEQYFDTICKENTVIMSKNIQESNTGGQQEKNCNTKKKSTIKSRKSISSTEKGVKTMRESSHISLEQKSASVASLDDKATKENNNTKQQSITLTDDTTVLQNATPSKIQKSTSSPEKGAKTLRKSSRISPGEKSAVSLDDKVTKENKNTKQQSVTLTDDTTVLMNATPSKIQASTPTKRIIYKELSKVGTPSTSNLGMSSTSNLGTPSTSNLGTPSTSNFGTPSTTKSDVSSDFSLIGPDEYDEKLFMNVSIVLNDIDLNKYNVFLNHNNNRGGNDYINSLNKNNRSPVNSSQVNRTAPSLKRLSAESDESEGDTVDKTSRPPPKLKKHVTFSRKLSIESEDSDQGAASDSTVDLEGLMISRKRGFVRLSKMNEEKQIKISSPSNDESVLATVNRKTINEAYNMKTETKRGNDNKDQQNEITVKPSSSPLKISNNMKRKLFSPEKMEYLLSGEEQEQFSSVLSMFDENEDSIKGISLDHSYSILSKDSSVQNTISDIRTDAENNDNNSDKNNSTTTAVVNHYNEVVNSVLADTLNKQTKSVKDNNDIGEINNSVVKMIDNSGSSERVNYKNDGTTTTTTTTTTTSTSPVLSTRPPKPRQTLIKSHGAAVTAPSYNDVEIYTASMKRKSITSASSNTKFRKMVRFDYTMPRRKRSSVLKPPAQMETEDDIHNGKKAITVTRTTGDSVKHQYYDGSCDLSIISGYLVDLHPHVLGTMDLIIGHCMMPCGVHRYSDLIWIKNEETEEPRCPACFKLGVSRKVHLMFMFNITVMAMDGNLYNVLVFEQHAEHFLGCSVQDYIESKAKRILIRDTIESYMVNATSGRPNAPKIRFCICDSNGIKILMKDVTTSSIEHV